MDFRSIARHRVAFRASSRRRRAARARARRRIARIDASARRVEQAARWKRVTRARDAMARVRANPPSDGTTPERFALAPIPSVSSFGGGLMNYEGFFRRNASEESSDGDVERGGVELASPGTLKRANAATPVKVWGREVRMSEIGLLLTLSGGALFAYVAFTMTQEGVFRRATKDFKYGGVVSLCTSLVYCALAQCERVSNGDELWSRRGDMKDYVLLSVMTSGSMYLTNAALSYINYTTRIVAKCSKVIPVMIVGTIMQGRRYGVEDYLMCALLVLGITMFTMGDVDSFPNFDYRGIAYITVALFTESTAGNFEERRFFNLPKPISHCEVVFYVNAIGSAWITLGLFASGELFVSVAHVLREPTMLAAICLAAAFGYISVTCILLCLRHYGATNTEVIKAVRKMLSLALSLLVYPKPMGWKYVVGTAATVVALFGLYKIKMRRLRAAGFSMEAAK